MRALITGPNGSCAYYLAAYLRERGHEVSGIGRPEHDLMYPHKLPVLLAERAPDVVYHLAANAKVRESFDNPWGVIENNLRITVNLFEALRIIGLRPVVVICSTSEVYGDADHQPIGETWALQPWQNPYAVSKAGQEHIAQHYAAAHAIPIVITRAFGYINPRRAGLSLTSFARQIAEIEAGKRSILEHGNLQSIRTFCDVRDAVRAYAMAAELGRGTYNIGSEEPISIWQCLEALKSMARTPIPTHVDAALVRPSDIRKAIPDTFRFRQATGWQPEIPLASSLEWLLAEARANLG